MSDSYLLLLARAEDSSVRVLARQAANRLAHASIADLSAPGWQCVVGCPERATARADGRTLEVARIAAVLCRIPRVTASDLQTIHSHDREYAAAETTAFLRVWLLQFRGIRCNEPTWMSLAGSGWHPLYWTHLVAGLGIPVLTVSRAASIARMSCETATAIVAGSEVFGVAEPLLVDHSLRIACAVKARSLAIRFVRDRLWRFQSADPCPKLDEPAAAALLRDVFAASTRHAAIASRASTEAGVSCDVR